MKGYGTEGWSAFLHKIPRYPVETAFTDTNFQYCFCRYGNSQQKRGCENHTKKGGRGPWPLEQSLVASIPHRLLFDTRGGCDSNN